MTQDRLWGGKGFKAGEAELWFNHRDGAGCSLLYRFSYRMNMIGRRTAAAANDVDET